MVPGRKAGEFSWRAIRFGATLGGSEETSEDRGSSLLVPWGGGGETRAGGPGSSDNPVMLLFSKFTLYDVSVPT